MMDIIVFGTGKVGREAIQFLEQQYNILFAVDNDKSKWGGYCGSYIIKSPDAVRQCGCDIVIASTKYCIEIAGQLKDMGIGTDRLYLFRPYQTETGREFEVHAIDAENIVKTDKSLYEYDLLRTGERDAGLKKVLVFCTFYSTFTKQLIENIAKRCKDIEFSILTHVNAKEYKEKISSRQLKHIYCFQTMADLKTIFDQLPVYDAFHLLWIEHEWAYFYKLIRVRTKRLIINVGGSDFYRTSSAERGYKNNLIECADKINMQTPDTLKNFKEYYKNVDKSKLYVFPYGIQVLEYIKQKQSDDKIALRKKYSLPTDKIIVTCGHNAGEAHQHIEMLEAINKLPDDVKRRIVCVVPMTYPSGVGTYIRKVKNKLDELGIEYLILTEWMDFEAMAEYALVSDIMIHVQTTDLISSTMREEMYAGSVVIAGSWLPYKSLHELGIYFLDVDAIPDLTAILSDVVENIGEYKDKCRGNRELVWEHSSWDRLAPRWRALWD